MSLARIAIRLAVVGALKDRTEAGPNVLDSEIGVLDVKKDGNVESAQTKPFVAVYTADSAASVEDMRSLGPNGSTWLQIDFGVTAAMAVRNSRGAATILPGIPATDGGLELTIDVIGRQITNALADPDNEWSELFRRFVNRVTRIETESVRNGEDGQRLAARQIRIAIDVKPDPVYGAPLANSSPWLQFMEKVRLEQPGIAATIEPLLGLPDGGICGDQVVRRGRGLTVRETVALGMGASTDRFGL